MPHGYSRQRRTIGSFSATAGLLVLYFVHGRPTDKQELFIIIFNPWKISKVCEISQKIGQSVDSPKLPFLPNFSWVFVCMDSVNTLAKFEVRSFTRSCDNRGYSKKIRQSLDTPTLPFLQNFSWDCVQMDSVNVSTKFAFCSP